MSIHALIFDLDGTMVHTLGDFEAAINLTLADLDVPPATPEVVGMAVGKGSEHLIRTVLTHQLGLPGQHSCAGRNVDSLVDPAWQRYQHHYRRINGQYSSLYTGVLETLQQLQQLGLPIACVTNKPVLFANELMLAKDMRGFFHCVFGGDSLAHKKPHPMPLLACCQALGTEPAHTLMVGDSRNDAQAARAAGCPVLLVTYGYNHGEPVESVDCDGLLQSFDAVLQHV